MFITYKHLLRNLRKFLYPFALFLIFLAVPFLDSMIPLDNLLPSAKIKYVKISFDQRKMGRA